MISDEQRIDPAQVRHWRVTAAGTHTIVLATCAEEAKAVGAYWIGVARGRTIPLDSGYLRAKEVEPEDVQRWLALRRQDRDGVAIRGTGATQ